MRLLFAALLALVVCVPAVADVKLVIRDFSGKSSTIYSNGGSSRIETPQMSGYAIVDHGSGEIMVVDTERNQVTRWGLAGQVAAGGGTQLGVSLKDKGGGRKIAGYLTRKHEIVADGEHCGTVYASRKLLKNSVIRSMFESMRGLQALVSGMTAGISGFMPVCRRATLQLAAAMDAAGAPLRVLDAAGKLISEVVSVDTDSKVAAASYQLPAGMQVVGMNETMNRAVQQLQNMPEMSQLMQQLQAQGGAASPEMKQQMEQLENMPQQLQQQ